ncbi:MAG: sulfotransferase domain-containing protein [Dehalococcoidia bacterium]
MLDSNVNYVVSGLERSGTSVMMQMLHNGGLPMAYDDSRPPDEHNPRGYFELAGGRIISRLMDGTFDLAAYKGQIIKITAYGLKFLPKGDYKIVYMQRDIDEVLDSMQKMGGRMDKAKERILRTKLNKLSLEAMESRGDMEYVTVNYRDVIDRPKKEMEKVGRFLGAELDKEAAIEAVDSELYRNRSPQ